MGVRGTLIVKLTIASVPHRVFSSRRTELLLSTQVPEKSGPGFVGPYTYTKIALLTSSELFSVECNKTKIKVITMPITF